MLLSLLNNALHGVTTLEAEYRDRICPEPSLSLDAIRSEDPSRPRAVKVMWKIDGPFAQVEESSRRVTWSAPDRLRVELRSADRVIRVAIRDGRQWWRWDAMAGSESGTVKVRQESLDMPPLLDPTLLVPARLLGWLRIVERGAGIRAGRRVVTAVGSPRSGQGLGQYDLEFDAEHGTLLRMVESRTGRALREMEAVCIRYDYRVADALFSWPER